MRSTALVSLALTLMLTLASPAVMAQQGGPPPNGGHQGGGQQFMQRLQQDLGLSNEQAGQVQQILQQQRSQMQALGQNATPEQRQAIHQQTQAALQKVLSPDQFSKLQSMMHHRHHHHHQQQQDQQQQ